MKRLILATTLFGLFLALATSEVCGQEVTERRKLAQTGMKFLSMSVDARAGAMADAVTAQEGTSVAMFYNPAGMASLQSSFHVGGGQVQSIADVRYNSASAAFRPAGGRYGIVGLSLLVADYGEFLETVRADNESGYIDTGTYNPTALAVGAGYAIALTDRFSVGGNIKYARQSFGSSIMSMGEGGAVRESFSEGTVAFDFGTLYRTGFQSLNFAMTVRNFGREVTYVQEGFELPLTFRIGISMDMLDFTDLNQQAHSLLLSVDAVRPRDFREQLAIGGEYVFMNLLSLRAGYVFPTDEQALNLGVGLSSEISGFGFAFDYAYSQFGALGNLNRLGVQFSF